jgi:regulator of nucleoside diphosphate kinase
MRDSRIQKRSQGSTCEAFETQESAEVRSAFDAFRMARSAALMLVVVAAVVISTPAEGGGHGHIAASLTGLAIAIYIARGGRRRLRAALNKSAQRSGMRAAEARLHAEALFERLTWQEPTHAIDWVPHHASLAKPCREPVRELPYITITGMDRERLSHLLGELDAPVARDFSLLDRELARAQVVPSTSIAPDVVTMNSRVRFADEDKGVPREVTLVYPRDASVNTARVSVLSPVGSALLGLKVGQAIEWPFPDGHRERYRVLAVAYQPEASGHFHL